MNRLLLIGLIILFSSPLLSAERKVIIVDTLLLQGHTGPVYTVAYRPGTKSFYSGSRDGTISIWDEMGRLTDKVVVGYSVFHLDFDRKGASFLVTSNKKKSIAIYNQDNEVERVIAGLDGFVNKAVFSPNNKFIAAGLRLKGLKKNLLIMQRSTGRILRKLNAHYHPVYAVKYSPNGKGIATGAQDNTIKLWQINGLQKKPVLKHRGYVWDLCYTPDGKKIITCSTDKTVKIWSVDGNLIKTLTAANSAVWSLLVTPKGHRIIAGTRSGGIIVWDKNGKLILKLKKHTDGVVDLALSPDGKTLVSASRDKSLVMWKFKNAL